LTGRAGGFVGKFDFTAKRRKEDVWRALAANINVGSNCERVYNPRFNAKGILEQTIFWEDALRITCVIRIASDARARFASRCA
jgi:hypothetical protein